MRSKRNLFVLLAFILLVLTGCLSVVEKVGRVRGVVIDNYMSVEGLRITLAGQEVLTPTDGAFNFSDIGYGIHTLAIFDRSDEVYRENIYVSKSDTFISIILGGEIPVRNASFEESLVNDTAPGWSSNDNPFTDYPWIEVSEEQAHTGDYSLKLLPRTPSGSASVRSDLIPARPGALYTASAMAYAVQGIAPHPRIYVEFWDEERALIERDRTGAPGVEKTWVPVAIDMVAPPGTAYVSVWFYTNTNFVDIVYWDDVTLEVARTN